MAYNPAEPTAIDRVRGVVGDTADPPLLAGGETRYAALVAATATEAAAIVAAARALAAQLRLEAVSLSGGGESVSYLTTRADALDAIALRYEVVAAAASGVAVLSFVPVTYRATTAADEFSR